MTFTGPSADERQLLRNFLNSEWKNSAVDKTKMSRHLSFHTTSEYVKTTTSAAVVSAVPAQPAASSAGSRVKAANPKQQPPQPTRRAEAAGTASRCMTCDGASVGVVWSLRLCRACATRANAFMPVGECVGVAFVFALCMLVQRLRDAVAVPAMRGAA